MSNTLSMVEQTKLFLEEQWKLREENLKKFSSSSLEKSFSEETFSEDEITLYSGDKPFSRVAITNNNINNSQINCGMAKMSSYLNTGIVPMYRGRNIDDDVRWMAQQGVTSEQLEDAIEVLNGIYKSRW